ncbi:myosin-9 [Electrophorus electricus]|uniref:B30.2/SPRY domain-containing protein n=1 Tax=Electrophorus electricus TaxID=8005 RepID=A0A4W4EXT9_ELEEL|nr:myosin-9 [Electrophorus electricus]
MVTKMSWIHLLLLCCMTASATWHTAHARSVLGDEPEDSDEELETLLMRFCEGTENELKTCSKRLVEKTEHSSNLENELNLLKVQLKRIQLTCKDETQASNVQISALQVQLDSLLRQLGEKTEGPAKAVLEILQKYIKMKKLEMEITMETDTAKIAEKENQLKKAKEEMDEATANLSKVKMCQTGSSSEIAEINALQEEIDKLRTGNPSAAQSSQIEKLQKQLQQKLKLLEEKGDATSKQVTQLIGNQDEVLAIERKLADLQKTKVEHDALKKQLEEAKRKLSKLRKENEMSSDKVTDEEIIATERDVKALGDDLEALNHILSETPDLEKELLKKKKKTEDKLDRLQKDGQELVSKILALQFQVREIQIRAQGEKAAADFQIADLQKQLRIKEKYISDLLTENEGLEIGKAEHCQDLEEAYNEIVDMIQKVPEANLKLILEIVSLTIEIESLTSDAKGETSESKISELRKKQREMIHQLNSKKQELYENDSSAEKILNIVAKMKQIWKLQNLAVNEDQIKVEEQELLKLISQLEDSNPAKILLKNMAMLSDETWLKKRIAIIKEQTRTQIAELQEKISKNEELLRKKNTELDKAHSDVEKLTKEISDLQEELKGLKKMMTDVQLVSAKRLKELENELALTKEELKKGNDALKQKDSELATKVNKITELIEQLKKAKDEAHNKDQEMSAQMSDLEAKLKQKEEEISEVLAEKKRLEQELKEAKECSELNMSYEELQTNFQNTVSKLNNSLAYQVFTVKTLTQEVEMLEKKISSSEGNVDALKQQLRKKNAELGKVQKEVKKSRAEYAELLQVLEKVRKLSRQQEQSIDRYLAEIARLEKDVEDLMAKLTAAGDHNAKQTIEVIFLKEELAKLEKLQAELKEDTSKKIADLEKQIAEKNKEIAYLKKSGCGTAQLKKEIAQLQQVVMAKEQQLTQLKKNARTQMAVVQRQLAEKTKKLEASEQKLKEKDSQNADLIDQLTELSKQLTEATSGKETITRALQRQISGLKRQVKDQEKEVSELQKNKAALRKALDRKQEELSKVKQELKEREAAITELDQRILRKEDELAREQKAHDDVLEQNKQLSQQLEIAMDKLEKLEVEKPDRNINILSPALDPDTAHRRLLLYKGNTMVRVSKFPRVVPENPERYDTALAALGDTGYESGRRYWEVQVDSRSCFVVGVATQSARRKGEINYGPKYGYWGILKRRDGSYVALTNKPIVLNIPGKLTVVGVLVDFSRGKITFYDAKIKTPIYTFPENDFDEPLYPYIATCSEEEGEPPIVFLPSTSALWLKGN